jgi:hypothetical protein
MVGKFVWQKLFIDLPLTHHHSLPSSLTASFTCPHGHKTHIPTHRSPRIDQRQGGNEVRRLDVHEKEQVGKVRAEVMEFSTSFTISPLLVDCCGCANKQQATINRLQVRLLTRQENRQTHNNQPSEIVYSSRGRRGG